MSQQTRVSGFGKVEKRLSFGSSYQKSLKTNRYEPRSFLLFLALAMIQIANVASTPRKKCRYILSAKFQMLLKLS